MSRDVELGATRGREGRSPRASLGGARNRSPNPWAGLFRLFALYALTSAVACILGAHLVWNATPSARLGLYWLEGGAVGRGEVAAFRVPPSVRRLVHDRRYLPDGALLIKPIVAVAGDTVCVRDATLFVDGSALGPVRAEDSAGRPLPRFAGCGALQAGRVFVASAHPRSFDSRAFGPIELRTIKGTVTPLWTYGRPF